MGLERLVQTVLVPFAVSAVGAAFCFGTLRLRRLGRELRVKGVTARALVVQKLRKDGEGWLENFYAIVYFVDGQHRSRQMEIKVDSRSWWSLREGGTTTITYLPDHPETAGIGPVWGRKLVGAFLLYIALVGAAVAVLGVGLPAWESLQSNEPGVPFAGILAVVLFVAGVPAVLVLSRRQDARRKAAMTKLTGERGWAYLGRGAPQLLPLLQTFTPKEDWTVWNVGRAEVPPGPLYLFEYRSHTRGSSVDSLGYACLAEAKGPTDDVVNIHRRVPLVDTLTSKKQEVGDPEFRKEFVVACGQFDVAQAALTFRAQKALLEHAAGPGWYVDVWIGRAGVLVASPHAVGPAEWDQLMKLAAAIRPD